MKPQTLRARIALWTVGVVCGALVLFGAGAAWNLRKELVKNLDDEIGVEGRDLISEMEEQHGDWSDRDGVAAFFAEESKKVDYLEVRDSAGNILYRSSSLTDEDIFDSQHGSQPYDVPSAGRSLRFRHFSSGEIQFVLGKDPAAVKKTLAGLASAYFFTLPFVLIAVGGGGWWIAHRVAAAVKGIAAQAEKISASGLHRRLPAPTSQDEIGHLTLVLNQMFDRLQRSFEQVTRFTSDASHELKTPLAVMRAQLEGALASPETGRSQRAMLSELIDECSQLTQIIDGLLFLSRADDRRLALEQSSVDLVALVLDLSEDVDILAAQAALTLRVEMPARLLVPGDLRLIRRAVMNLIDNAIKYNRRGGAVIVCASSDHTNAVLRVLNTGAGIPPAACEKVFDRFYRIGPEHGNASAGHGLGLSIAREIARAHGGDVAVLRSDKEWTEFSLTLPLEGGLSASGLGEPGVRDSVVDANASSLFLPSPLPSPLSRSLVLRKRLCRSWRPPAPR